MESGGASAGNSDTRLGGRGGFRPLSKSREKKSVVYREKRTSVASSPASHARGGENKGVVEGEVKGEPGNKKKGEELEDVSEPEGERTRPRRVRID